MKRTKIENVLLYTALRRLGKALTYRTNSMTNELIGIGCVATDMNNRGMVSIQLWSDIQSMISIIQDIEWEAATKEWNS